jgi:hypothetical protein
MTIELADGTKLRRDFQLAEDDVQCLEEHGFKWETVMDGGSMWLVIRGYAIPEGYNIRTADLALRIPPSYPDEQIDMVYFSPSLSLMTGREIRQLTAHTIDGEEYQQWSRHRTPANPWRPDLDNVCSHLLQVDTWLRRELK